MPSVVRAARVIDSALSVDRLVTAVSDPAVGGIALFVGVVRNTDEGHSVTSLDYTGHPLAEQVLRSCAERVAQAHEVLSVAVEHRVGHLEVGDLAVVVAVGSVHRRAALAACQQLIDDLKVEVPIWKEQQLSSGASEWIGLP
jgi:molybdopterin synthase catalytic subunit